MIVFILLPVCITIAAGTEEGRRHIVPDQYDTIQKAIDIADSGDTIYIKAGLYT